MRDRNRSVPAQIVLGFGVIAVGLMFLLDNLDIIDFHDALHFWPLMFILFGLMKVLDSQAPGGKLAGAVLIVVGAGLTLRGMGVIYFSWQTVWPVLLIIVGLSVLRRALERKERGAGGANLTLSKDESSVVDVTAILGGVERQVVTPTFRGGEATAIMGGCVLDLRQSGLEGEAVVNVFALMGGITLRVPVDWTVVLNGTPIIGGFDEKTASPAAGTKRLVVRGYAIMGGVEVRN